MQNKSLILFIVILLGCSSIAVAEEINVTDANYVWNLTLDNSTDINRLIGEPGVIVVKYADDISYQPLENASSVNRLVGEPGVIVVKYADDISYQPLENASSVNRLVGEPGVIVVKYADDISYQPLNNPTSVGRRELEINITYPLQGALIENSSVMVNGTATSPNEIISVTVNGITANGTTSWSATIPLITGINTITVNVTTNTTYSEAKSIKVFHYTEGNYIDTDGDGVIDSWDQENNTKSGFWVNPVGIGRMLGDLNGNGELDSGDVTLLMQKIVGLVT
jgi:hypothetical protein